MSYFDHTNQKPIFMKPEQLSEALQTTRLLIESIYYKERDFKDWLSYKGRTDYSEMEITRISFSGHNCYIKLETFEKREYREVVAATEVFEWYLQLETKIKQGASYENHFTSRF